MQTGETSVIGGRSAEFTSELKRRFNNQLGRPHPGLSWKYIARQYQRQVAGVACRYSTPEYFRGVWRIPERDVWKKGHLHTVESPPFFLKAGSRRSRHWRLKQSETPAAARGDAPKKKQKKQKRRHSVWGVVAYCHGVQRSGHIQLGVSFVAKRARGILSCKMA